MIKKNLQIRHKIIAIIIFTALCVSALWLIWPLTYNPLKVIIELKSDQHEICQIFYDKGNGFSGKHSIKKKYTGSYFQRLEFTLPKTAIRHLRIDPGVNSDTYIIRRIIMKSGGLTIKYSGQSIAENFILQNFQPVRSIPDEGIRLKAANNPDVQMLYRHNTIHAFPLVRHKLKFVILAAAALTYLTGLLLIITTGFRLFRLVKSQYTSIRALFENDFSVKNIKLFLNRNSSIIIWSFLLAIFAWGYELFNFTLSPDEEINSFITAPDATVYIDVGRWGIYFLNHLLSPESVLPYFPFLIAIVCLATSSVLLITRFRLNLNSMLIFSIIFISHPIHSYYLGFNTSNMYYGIGMVLTILSFLAFSVAISKKSLRKLLLMLSVILLMFGLSFYQSLLAFFLVPGIFFLFYREYQSPNIPPDQTFKNILLMLSIVVAAVVFYQIINMLIKQILIVNITEPSMNYLDKMYAWNKRQVGEILLSLIQGLSNYFTGKNFYGGIAGQTMIVITPLVIYYIFHKTGPVKNKLFLLLLMTMLIVAPFTIVFLIGSLLPVRTLMAFPLMLGLLWAFSYRQSAKWLRSLMLVFTFYILINNTYTNTRLFYASKVSWEADRNMAVRITSRIYDLELPDKEEQIKVVFTGSYQHPPDVLFIRSDIHGSSFFNWDHGASYRIREFFKTLGIHDLKIIDYSRLQHLTPAVNEMPAWPAPGSVKLVGGIVIVKLSENNSDDL